MHITRVMGLRRLHVRTFARVDVPPFPYFANGRSDCAEFRYVVTDSLPRLFTQVDDGVQMHVLTYPPLYRISGTAGRIVLKLGVWLGDC